MSVIMFNYSRDHSIGNDPVADMRLGIKHGAVGFSRQDPVCRGDKVLVKAGWAGPFAAGVIVKENPAHRGLWSKKGGRMWMRTFDVEFLTPVVRKVKGVSLHEAKDCHWSKPECADTWTKVYDRLVVSALIK